MSVSPLLPAAGLATVALARGAAAAVSDGFSFVTELLRPTPQPEIAAATEKQEQPSRDQFTTAIRDFASRLQQRLAAAGVAPSQPLELVSDGLGGVQVSGDHPDRALIEQTLNSDPSLLAQFQQLGEQCRQLSPSERQNDRRDFGLVIAGEQVSPFLQ